MDEDAAKAVRSVLPDDDLTGDDRIDLVRALGRIEGDRRTTPTRGGAIVRALRAGGQDWRPLSWREIEQATGVDPRTAGRWADED